MMQGWAAIAGVGAVLFAARKAADTFAGYRRQKQEDRRIDAAERILTLAYTLKRNLTAVRSPMSMGDEIWEAEQQLQEADWYNDMPVNRQSKARTGQVILRRLAKNKPEWDLIFSTMPVARALFGEHVEAHLQAIWEQVVAVKVSAEMYRDDEGHDPEFTARMERDFWGIGGPNDPINPNLDAAVEGLEAELLPIIRAEHAEGRS